MPKKVLEINKFSQGINSTVSGTDTNPESASYSLNVEPSESIGRLQGIDKTEILTVDGFQVVKNIGGDEVNPYIVSIELSFNDTNRTSYQNYGTSASNTRTVLTQYQSPLSDVVFHEYDMYLKLHQLLKSDGVTTTNTFTEARYIDIDLSNSHDKALLLFTRDRRSKVGYIFFDDSGYQHYIQALMWYSQPSSTVMRLKFDTHPDTFFDNNTNFGVASSGANAYLYAETKVLNPFTSFNFGFQSKVYGRMGGFCYIKNTENHFNPPIPPNSIFGSSSLSGALNNGYEQSVDLSVDTSANLRTQLLTGMKGLLDRSEFDNIISETTISGESLLISLQKGDVEQFQFKTRVSSMGHPVLDRPFKRVDGTAKRTFEDNVSVGPNSPIDVDIHSFVVAESTSDETQINLVGIKENKEGVPSFVSMVQDIHGRPGNQTILKSVLGKKHEYHLEAIDDKVLIGLGGMDFGVSKVGLKNKLNPLAGNSIEEFNIYDAELKPLDTLDLATNYSHYITPEIHGFLASNATEGVISKDDSFANAIRLDYDFVLEADPSSRTLAAAVKTSSGSNIAGIKIGQVFKCSHTTDFSDGAMVKWKKYNYDATASAVVGHASNESDLFMFCGYVKNRTVPILNYIGKISQHYGGTPAFAYAIKKNEMNIYRISLTSTGNYSNDTAFDGTTSVDVKDESGADYNLTNTGKRIETFKMNSINTWPTSRKINALAYCRTPLFHNDIGLAGESGNPWESDGELFYNNGHLKIYYRHNVFWMSAGNNSTVLYRINLIDFDNLSDNAKFEAISLDFSKIPRQLQAEDEDGMIRMTMCDLLNTGTVVDKTPSGESGTVDGNWQETAYVYNPKFAGWDRYPKDAIIVGICETFDYGEIRNNVQDMTGWYNNHNARAIKHKKQPRLSTGDKIKFMNLNTSSANFNNQPHTVYRTEAESSIIDSADAPAFQTDETGMWWNGKVWLMYRKISDNDSFKDWDLFTYNANVLESSSYKNLVMADRTPAFAQARYNQATKRQLVYNDFAGIQGEGLHTGDWSFESGPAGTDDEYVIYGRIWYPGDSAFIMTSRFPNFPDGSPISGEVASDELGWGMGRGIQPRNYLGGDWLGYPYNIGGVPEPGEILADVTSWQIDTEPNGSLDGYDLDNSHHGIPRMGCRHAFFGIYDKTGHWTPNGGEWVSPIDAIQEGGTSLEGSQQRSICGLGNLSGHEEDKIPYNNSWKPFGDNIGWAFYDTRKTKPVAGSLHPQVQYSSTYNAGLFYAGKRYAGIDSDTTSSNSFNRVKHAVSFISNISGTFVGTLGYARVGDAFWNQHYLLENGDFDADLWNQDSVGLNANTYLYPEAYKYFNTVGSNETPDTLQKYDNDYVMMSVDDWSGHTGFVNYAKTEDDGEVANGGALAGKYTDPTKKIAGYFWAGTGGQKFTPNFGGNEIHNPRNKVKSQWIKCSDWGGTSQLSQELADNTQNYHLEVGCYSSVNGGAAFPSAHSVQGLTDEDGVAYTVHPKGDDTDKGWDGYHPPYLFNAGIGNYVYINRKWTNGISYSDAQDGVFRLGADALGNDTERLINDAFWQYDNTNNGAGNNQKHTACWNNFSITSIMDNSMNTVSGFNPLETTPYKPEDHTPMKNGRFGPAQRLAGSSHALNSVVARKEVNSGRADSVCTFHKINIYDGNYEIVRINNSAPFILRSTLGCPGVDGVENDFTSAYMCGVTFREALPDSPSSAYTYKGGLLIVSNNFDTINHKFVTNIAGPQYNANDGSYEEIEQNFADGATPRHRALMPIYNIGLPGTNAETDINGVANTLYSRISTNTHALESFIITSTVSDYELFDNNDFYANQTLGLRASALQFLPVTAHDANVSVMPNDRLTPQFMNTSQVEQNGLLLDFYIHTRSIDGAYEFWGYEDNYYSTDVYSDAGSGSVKYGFENGGAFDNSTDSGAIITSSSDSTIISRTKAFIEFSLGNQVDTGPFDDGTYYYKFALVYDGQYESPLHIGEPIPKEITVADGADPYEYIKLNISIQPEVAEGFNKRVTALSVYRRKDGREIDDYYLLGQIDFSNKGWWWDSSTGSFKYDLYDYNNTMGTYEATTGLPQSLPNTTLNYGIGEVHQGYMYVAKAWNRDLGDVRNYIFRSQPFNYFAFNWAEDYLIMPEEPIALASFNSRLYAWGFNSLYKINPHTMVIEDEFEGVSILNKDCFVKTEFGLCFFDKNNIYLHDGNMPRPIGDPILYASDNKSKHQESIEESTQGNIRLQQGFKELLEETINSRKRPSIHYLGKKQAFIISLSDESTQGRVYAYSLKHKRWDLWKAPHIQSAAPSKESKLLVSDGSYLYDYTSSITKQYSGYNRETWEWISKDIIIGTSSQDKVFKTLSFTGTPSVYNYNLKDVNEFNTYSNLLNSIQAYVDDKPISLTVYNKFYATSDLGDTITTTSVLSEATQIKVKLNINLKRPSEGVTAFVGNSATLQTFIRKGHLIKIDDEIMLVTGLEYVSGEQNDTNHTIITVKRAQMNTTKASHSQGSSVYVVSPKFKFAGGTKGRKLSIRLFNQQGHVDSIGVTYKDKSPK